MVFNHLSFLLSFGRSVLLLNRNKNIGNDLLVFYKLPFPSTFILLSLPFFDVFEKKHEWKRSIATNKAHFFKPMFLLSNENAQYHQNRRQKVFNRRVLRLCRGFDISKFDKLNWFVVFNTSNWGCRDFLGEDLTHKTPRGDENEYHQTIWTVKSHSCALATFRNIVKTLKEGEPIWIMCVPCSYFDKFLYLF